MKQPVLADFELFAFNTVAPDEFVALAQAANQPYALLHNGERLRLTD